MAYTTIEMSLSFAKPDPEGSFCDHGAWFEHCVERFNEKCSKSTSNQKQIKIKKIKDDEIDIELISEQDLGKAPGRALSGFSKMLITNDNSSLFDSYYVDNVFHGKVFTTQSKISDNKERLSDEEVVKVLIDYLVTPKSKVSKGKIQAFEQIRKIVEMNGFVLEKESK